MVVVLFAAKRWLVRSQPLGVFGKAVCIQLQTRAFS
jgi:hypothetical protein